MSYTDSLFQTSDAHRRCHQEGLEGQERERRTDHATGSFLQTGTTACYTSIQLSGPFTSGFSPVRCRTSEHAIHVLYTSGMLYIFCDLFSQQISRIEDIVQGLMDAQEEAFNSGATREAAATVIAVNKIITVRSVCIDPINYVDSISERPK